MIAKLSGAVKAAAKGLLLASILWVPALAQQQMAMLTSEPIEFASAGVITNAPLPPDAPSQHCFWDTQNGVLFSAVAVSSMADFAVTRANLQNGGRELNPMTRVFSGSTAGLAVNFVGETAAVVGLSYYFHRTGHHRLERIAPVVNFGASALAVSYGLSHRR
jgi:hypothetical protein